MRHRMRRVHSPGHQPVPREGAEQFRAPQGGTRFVSAGSISLVVLGLLCHLTLFFLLSFPYISVSSPYGNALTFTGWNLGHTFLIGGNLISAILPTLILLPLLPYLACLLSFFLRRERTKIWLEGILYLNVPLNLLSFLVLYGLLSLAQMTDPLHMIAARDASYAIHLVLFLLSAICSSVSSIWLGLLLRRSRINAARRSAREN